jgi:MFS-type transporter involved in bile tolerance (Atg22 family)
VHEAEPESQPDVMISALANNSLVLTPWHWFPQELADLLRYGNIIACGYIVIVAAAVSFKCTDHRQRIRFWGTVFMALVVIFTEVLRLHEPASAYLILIVVAVALTTIGLTGLKPGTATEVHEHEVVRRRKR